MNIYTRDIVNRELLVNVLDACLKAAGLGESVIFSLKTSKLFDAKLAVGFMQYKLGDEDTWQGIPFANSYDFMQLMRDKFDGGQHVWYDVLTNEFGDFADDIDEKLYKVLSFAIGWCESAKFQYICID